MQDQRIKVLFITGAGHSGSTILSKVLGQIRGYADVGEIVHLWSNLRHPRRRCGCGAPHRECPVWQGVFAEAFGGFDGIDFAAYERHKGHLRRAALLNQRGPGFEDFLAATGALYKAVSRVTESRVIVDSSKSVYYGRLLETLPHLDLHVLHLVRDPRGVVFSTLRKRQALGGQPHAREAWRLLGSHSKGWINANLSAELLWRRPGQQTTYLRVRYEDFVARPAERVRQIAAFVGEPPGALPFVSAHEADLRPTHSASGNVARHRHGKVELRLDMRWFSQLKPRYKVPVTLLAWPLLWRYGYPVLSGYDSERPPPLR